MCGFPMVSFFGYVRWGTSKLSQFPLPCLGSGRVRGSKSKVMCELHVQPSFPEVHLGSCSRFHSSWLYLCTRPPMHIVANISSCTVSPMQQCTRCLPRCAWRRCMGTFWHGTCSWMSCAPRRGQAQNLGLMRQLPARIGQQQCRFPSVDCRSMQPFSSELA